MKKIFGTIKLIMSKIFTKKNFATAGIMLGIFVTLTSSVVFSSLFSEFTPSNISNSIGEILKNEDGDETHCVIYPHKLVNADVMTYHMPERTTKMRDLYPEQHFLDIYQADWSGLYSPASIQYEKNGQKNNLSFILMPKDTYIRSNWIYNEMEFIYPTTKQINAHNAPNEIYITKKYADYLISLDSSIQEGEYEKLVKTNNTYNIPYSWSFKNGTKISNPQYFDVYYKISGILNEDCKAYKDYQKLYGDFFIATELLDLPIPCITTFITSKKNKYSKNIFKIALKTYKYESRSSAINQSVGNMHFEYRISIFDKIDSNNSIKKIDLSPSQTQKEIDNIFNKFCYKDNILNLVVFALFLFVSMFGLVYFLLLYSREEMISKFKNKFTYFISALIICSISIVVGIVITKLINNLPKFLGLTQFNTISSIALIAISILYCALILIRFFKQKNN